MFRQRVGSKTDVFHVVRKKTHHQILYLLAVLVIHGSDIHVQCHKLWYRTWLSILFHDFQITVYHGQELQRIELFSFILDLHVEYFPTYGNNLTGLDLTSVVGKNVREVCVFYFVVSIACHLIDTMYGIIPKSSNLSCCNC